MGSRCLPNLGGEEEGSGERKVSGGRGRRQGWYLVPADDCPGKAEGSALVAALLACLPNWGGAWKGIGKPRQLVAGSAGLGTVVSTAWR